MPQKKILVVDDEKLVRTMLSDELATLGYEVFKAGSGEEALDIIGEISPDVILLDVIMPGLDGYEVCKMLKSSEATLHIPVIMLTGLTDKEAKIRGLDAGALDFLNKPVDMLELSVRLKNMLQIKEYADFLADYNKRLEDTVKEKTKELRQAFIDTIYRLTLAAEQKDECTSSHLKRVSHFCAFIAKEYGLSDQEAEIMFHASPMHDVGKIGIPDHILSSPDKLTPDELEIMKSHTTIGAKILEGSDSEYLTSARIFALYHHENWDGTGYPHGLSGEDIPIEGRIMVMADRYDALRSTRPYKKAIGHEKTIDLIKDDHDRTSSSHLEPKILELFMDNNKKFEEMYDKYSDD